MEHSRIAARACGDILRCAAQVRSRSTALLKKYPLSKCSAKVQAEAAEAERSRCARGGRKRFGGRYPGGIWAADGNGRTPHRPNRFHDSGARFSISSAAMPRFLCRHRMELSTLVVTVSLLVPAGGVRYNTEHRAQWDCPHLTASCLHLASPTRDTLMAAIDMQFVCRCTLPFCRRSV